MKIWVTGAAGSLGQELVRTLRVGHADAILLAPSRGDLDLSDKEAVRKYVSLHKPTHVFHLAAKVFGIAGHKEQPAVSMLENTGIDNSVFSALMEFPPTWVYYSSTVAAYGYPYSLPLNEDDWLSGNPHDSELGYAFSKRYGISYLEMLHSIHDTKFAYGLTTNLFGSGDQFHEGRGHVVISLLKKAAKIVNTNGALEVWGDGTASRDFLSTNTASRLIVALIDKHVGVINIASGKEIYIKEIAHDIASVFELASGVKFMGINQGITRRVCSIEKLLSFVGAADEIDSKNELLREIKAYRDSLSTRQP